jgi:hypothetical protein
MKETKNRKIQNENWIKEHSTGDNQKSMKFSIPSF